MTQYKSLNTELVLNVQALKKQVNELKTHIVNVTAEHSDLRNKLILEKVEIQEKCRQDFLKQLLVAFNDILYKFGSKEEVSLDKKPSNSLKPKESVCENISPNPPRLSVVPRSSLEESLAGKGPKTKLSLRRTTLLANSDIRALGRNSDTNTPPLEDYVTVIEDSPQSESVSRMFSDNRTLLRDDSVIEDSSQSESVSGMISDSRTLPSEITVIEDSQQCESLMSMNSENRTLRRDENEISCDDVTVAGDTGTDATHQSEDLTSSSDEIVVDGDDQSDEENLGGNDEDKENQAGNVDDNDESDEGNPDYDEDKENQAGNVPEEESRLMSIIYEEDTIIDSTEDDTNEETHISVLSTEHNGDSDECSSSEDRVGFVPLIPLRRPTINRQSRSIILTGRSECSNQNLVDVTHIPPRKYKEYLSKNTNEISSNVAVENSSSGNEISSKVAVENSKSATKHNPRRQCMLLQPKRIEDTVDYESDSDDHEVSSIYSNCRLRSLGNKTSMFLGIKETSTPKKKLSVRVEKLSQHRIEELSSIGTKERPRRAVTPTNLKEPNLREKLRNHSRDPPKKRKPRPGSRNRKNSESE